jgi:dienelactone hydrolase
MMAKGAWIAAAMLGCAGAADAKLVTEKIEVPVQVTDAYGKKVARDIVVTLFHDDEAPKPYPVALVAHGRSSDATQRASMGRAQFPAPSRWLAGLGFMVAVPTRLGYGVTGGEDVEDSGPCNQKQYVPVYAAGAEETLAVLAAVRKRSDVSSDRAIVVGQSFGGTIAIAIAAKNPPGIQATINFAGGGGGNPKTRPRDPCGEPLLKRLFADYGKTARIPTLWIYTENDRYWGPALPKTWFDAFKAAGGVGEHVLYPPNGEDGHGFFVHGPEAWQPKVLEFLRANGYAPAR